MNPNYPLRDPSKVYSPALLFYKDLIQSNIARAIAIAGGPDRLRPHIKTHKTREIVRMQLAAGITKHKCATIAEAELLASCGVADVMIAYPIVGPNCGRVARLAAKFPGTRFGITIDHSRPLAELGATLSAGQQVDAYLDINCGQNRTGIAPGEAALDLYRQIGRSQKLKPAGFHVYDGHNSHESTTERAKSVQSMLGPIITMRQELEKEGLSVPRLIMGGTPTFTIHAKCDLPGVECSPGTLALHDYNYIQRYPDLGITPAALLLTRVIGRPTADRVTLDLGYKAVSPDSPAGKRLLLLDFPENEAVLQNEEHLVVRTAGAGSYSPGDVVYAMPAHICPTVALHRQALIVQDGRVVERWDIAARDRELSV